MTDTPAKPQVDLKMLNHRVVQSKSFMQATETWQTVNFYSTYSKTRQKIHKLQIFGYFNIFAKILGYLWQLTSLPHKNIRLRATDTVGSICSEKMSFFFLLIYHFAKLCFPKSLALLRGLYCCCCCSNSLLRSKMKAFRTVCAIFWIFALHYF